MPPTTTVKVFAYLVGIPGEPFLVTIEGSRYVQDLKDVILKKNPNCLKNLDSGLLVLYKVDVLEDQLPMQAVPGGSQQLEACERLHNLFPTELPENKVNVFVEILKAVTIDSGTSDIERLPEPHRPELVIKLEQGRDDWVRLDRTDLKYNHVESAPSSSHLQDLQNRLQRKRCIDKVPENIRMPLGGTLAWQMPSSPHFERANSLIVPHALDYMSEDELLHYAHIIGLGPRSKAIYQEKREQQVWAIFQDILPRISSDLDGNWGFRSNLAFQLVIKDEKSRKNFCYQPRPDFHISIKDFPHLVLEVHLHSNEHDCYRMLLQVACIARIGNWLRDSATGKPVVIMAVYIDNAFTAHRFLLCQPDVQSNMVEYISDKFDLTDPQTASEFIFQLYNFLSPAVADNKSFRDPKGDLGTLKNSVERKGYPAVTTFKTTGKRKCEGPGNNSDRSDGSSAHGGAQGYFGNTSVQRELTKAGYTITEPISEELTLLTPLKPTMCEATSRSGVSVILKTIVDSNEHQFLQYLSDIKVSSNHTIPLLDVIDLRIGKTIIVLPWKSPLDEVLQLRTCPDDTVSLCHQFVEGVAFLHQHKVAHCDLKPGNVVIDTMAEKKTLPQLFIIDFDLALHVESEETMTNGWCGTPPWIAPEVGSRDGPICWYSPILADRWACGLMIKYFAMYFPANEDAQKSILLSFARRLLNMDPQKRPELELPAAIHGSTM